MRKPRDKEPATTAQRYRIATISGTLRLVRASADPHGKHYSGSATQQKHAGVVTATLGSLARLPITLEAVSTAGGLPDSR